MRWLKQVTQLEGLYLDGSTQLEESLFTHVVGNLMKTRSLRTLSIQGCSQLATRDFRDGMRAVVQEYPQFKVIGP